MLRRSARSMQLATGMRAEEVDGAVLVLDAANQAVLHLEGDPAEVVRRVIAASELPEHLEQSAQDLASAGVVAEPGAQLDESARRRRRFLTGAAVVAGIAVFRLPAAAAAASLPGDGNDGRGGDGGTGGDGTAPGNGGAGGTGGPLGGSN